MSDVKKLVDSKIANKKVMVFSKSKCPFCTKAKKVFKRYIKDGVLDEYDFEVMEIDRREDCSRIQDYLLKKTGGRSVPRVFIKKRFIGGGDEVVSKDEDGSLKRLLKGGSIDALSTMWMILTIAFLALPFAWISS